MVENRLLREVVRVSIHRNTQIPRAHGPEQPAVAESALSRDLD